MKTIVILILIFLAYRIVKRALMPIGGVRGHRAGGAAYEERPEDKVEEEMVQDPVCKSYVPVSTALTANIRGERKFFCGPECKARYIEQLEKGG